jgi:hypothetical protein
MHPMQPHMTTSPLFFFLEYTLHIFGLGPTSRPTSFSLTTPPLSHYKRLNKEKNE